MNRILDLRGKSSQKSSVREEDVSGKERIKIGGLIDRKNQTLNKQAIFFTSAVLVAIGAIYLLKFHDIIAAAFFFVVVFGIIVVVTLGSRKDIKWEADEHGIFIDGFPYPYEEFKSFWIEYQPHYLKELSLKSKKWYRSYFKIPLEQQDPLAIREHLLNFLPEERHEDTIVEIISRKLGI